MSHQSSHFYDFDRFRIDVAERTLLSDGEVVPLTQKAFDVLLVLVERRGQVVEKEELMRLVWPTTFVEEGNLSQNIYTLRKALGQTLDGQEFIKTVPKRGYRFIPQVAERGGSETDAGPVARLSDEPAEPEIFSDEDRLASKEQETSAHPAGNFSAAQELENRGSSQRGWMSRHKTMAAVVMVALATGVAAGLVWSAKSREGGLFSANSPAKISVTNLTTTGNIACAAVSPDGKYVAYGITENAQRGSLWITQIATMTSRQVADQAEIQYHAMTFSPDGQFIYYVTREDQSPRTLYRISALGGPPKRLIEKVETAISFSPDGKQFAFRRIYDERREASLLIADADGGNEREVTSIPFPENLGDPAWSPDGKLIACAAGNPNVQSGMYVAAVKVEDGTIRQITAKRWRWIGQLDWLADSTGLVMVAGEHSSAPLQVWRLNHRNGEAQRVTNDSNFYNRLSFAASSNTLVALQRRQVTNVWMISSEDAGRARQITFGAGGYRGQLSWTADGKILYDSETGDSPAISIMNADGGLQKQVVSELTARSYVGQAVASPDGRYIIFSSDFKGEKHIWRMNLDGSNPVQLTNGTGEDSPSCSPDGRWVVFTKLEHRGTDRPTLWRVSMDGGQPLQLTSDFTASPAVSPDGKLIACFYSEPNQQWQLAVYSFNDGAPVKRFPQQVQGMQQVRWTPDGRGLTYSENPVGPAKLWIQPIEGGPPKLLAEFASDRIFGFDWSRDGKQLACVRGIWATNAVLIKDFR